MLISLNNIEIYQKCYTPLPDILSYAVGGGRFANKIHIKHICIFFYS